jgi:hypothetical protein
MPSLSIPLSPPGNPPREDTPPPAYPEAAVHPDT